jgi:hypothetical protein
MNKKILGVVIGLAASISLSLAPASANAQRADRERASVYVGTFITDRNTSARVDSDAGNAGTDIDLEGDLGLKASASVVRAGGYVWISARQRLDLSYFDLSRTASRTIDKTINFDDKTFRINTVVNADNHLTITKLDYTFSFLNKDKWFLGVTGGLYVAQTKLSLSEPTLGVASGEGITAPLPVIGLRGDYAINDRWTLRGAYQWFGLSVDTASGHLTDLYAGVDYGFGKRFAIGLAYDTVSMNVKGSKPGSLNGRLDWGYNGWLLYFKTDFGGGVSKR